MNRPAALLVALLLAGGPVSADGIPPALTAGPLVRVAEVVDGDTVVLTAAVAGSRQVRLVGIQAPKLPLGRKDFPTWPLAEDAKRALGRLVDGRDLRLAFGGARRDRHDRHLAHLYAADGTWVQGEMLRLGMARVYSFADNRSLVAAMLALERSARTARRGIWRLQFYAVRRADDLAQLHHDVGTFQLVEGRVLDAAKVRSRIYLNFGDNWRDDFTVSLDARARRLFSDAGLDALALKGMRVRVRGWLKRRNGPLIVATHPEQVEVLER